VPRYTLRQLEYFVAVAEHDTVTAAARSMHVSASAMSTALSELEHALGVQLLVRHHAKGVTLTPAGDDLLASARALLRQADDLGLASAAWGEGVVGTVSLGCFAILSPHVLPAVLATAAERYPDLQVEPVEESLDGVEQGLLSGRFEVALTYDLGLGAAIERTRLVDVPVCAVLPAGHPRARRRTVRIAELADEPFVLLDLPHSRDYFTEAFDRAGVRPTVRYRTRSAETARALVGRGLAWTMLNLRPVHDLTVEGRSVVVRPIADDIPALSVVLATVAATTPSRRAAALAELASAVVTATG
jgi:DNA-binding transcriptional LysR family regulator